MAEKKAIQVNICVNMTCVEQGAGELIRFLKDLQFDAPVQVNPISCFGLCGSGPCAEVNGVMFDHLGIEDLYEAVNNSRAPLSPD